MRRVGGYRGPTQNRKGIPNKVNAVIRERIEESGDPVGFLIKIMNGEAPPVLDEKVNFLNGSYAISAGHLVKPVALNALVQTMLSETFDVSSFEAFPESLAHELERIEKAVAPR